MPSTPAQFQYQPLGLERFAQPMAMKQQKFDLAQEAIEASEFNVDGLDIDGERASAMSERLAQDKETLIDELQRTKNYKQAAKKIKELNKIYHGDPEISGIRQQKQAFQEWDKDAREEVAKGEMTLERYNRHKFHRMQSYNEKGGFGYDRETKASNAMNTSPIEKDLEPEIQKLSMELANATPLQLREKLTEWGVDKNIDGLISQFKVSVEERDLENVQREISQFLRQSKRYKDNIKSEAKVDFFWESRHNPNFSDNVIENERLKINSQKEKLLKQINSGQLTGEELEGAQQAVARLEEDNALLNGMYSQAVNQGKVDDLAEKLFTQNKYDQTMEGWSRGASDIKDVTRWQESNAVRNMPEGGSGGRGKLKSADEIKSPTRDIEIISEDGKYSGIVESSLAAGTSAHLEKVRNTIHTEEREEWQNDFEKTLTESEPLKEGASVIEKENHEIENTLSTVINRTERYEKRKAEIEKETADLKDKLETAESDNARSKYRSEITSLNEESKLIKESELVDLNPLEDILLDIMEGMSKVPEGPADLRRLEELQRIFNEEGASGVAKIMQPDYFKNSGNRTDGRHSIETGVYDFIEGEEDPDLREELEVNPFFEDSRLRYAFTEWKNQIVAGSGVFRTKEYVLTDEANKFTDNALQIVLDEGIKPEGVRGQAKNPAVSYDPSTGNTEIQKNIDYSKDAYNWNDASFISVGKGKDGSQPIVFRTTRKELGTGEWRKVAFDMLNQLNHDDFRGKKLEDIEESMLKKGFAMWEANNPKDLYVQSAGWDRSITDVKEAIDEKMIANLPDWLKNKDVKNIDTLRDTHAKWQYGINPTVKESYNEMSLGIKKMIEDKNQSASFTERSPEFIPTSDPKNPYKKNEVVYRLDQDDRLIMEIKASYYDKDFIQTGVTPDEDIVYKNVNSINPVDLVSRASFYGAGLSDVLIKHRTERGMETFIPYEFAID